MHQWVLGYFTNKMIVPEEECDNFTTYVWSLSNISLSVYDVLHVHNKVI